MGGGLRSIDQEHKGLHILVFSMFESGEPDRTSSFGSRRGFVFRRKGKAISIGRAEKDGNSAMPVVPGSSTPGLGHTT